MPSKDRSLLQRRPAELAAAGVAGAIVVVGLWIANAEPPAEVVAGMVLIVGAIPAGITWLVNKVRGT
ncbi:MAG: hypothetical protein WD739_07435 [Actinomycetota bacterium]